MYKKEFRYTEKQIRALKKIALLPNDKKSAEISDFATAANKTVNAVRLYVNRLTKPKRKNKRRNLTGLIQKKIIVRSTKQFSHSEKDYFENKIKLAKKDIVQYNSLIKQRQAEIVRCNKHLALY